jgi:leucyl aminopeptidase
MKITIKPFDIKEAEADLVVVFATMPDCRLTKDAVVLDKLFSGSIQEATGLEQFTGESAKTVHIHTHGKIPARQILLVGLGDPKTLSAADVLKIAAVIGRFSKRTGASSVAISIPDELMFRFPVAKITELFTTGLMLGTYTFLRHKSDTEKVKNRSVDDVLFLMPANRIEDAAKGIALGESVAGAVVFARDLVNEPSSVTTPTHLALVANDIAKSSDQITCEVLDREQARKLGMGAFLGIARGSDEEPKFIRLSYRGGGTKSVALVGKGITFDSGGLSLKSSGGMETMKLDMAGAANVLAIFHVLSALKPRVTVSGYIAATENMPSGKAIKPGDVVKAYNGKTIEILNTDAEGRVILADALSYAAATEKPDVMIDIATLTGACMVALGEDIAGVFTNNQHLGKKLLECAEESGEAVWELPLAREYADGLKSTVADLKNVSGSKYGGAINGALFLSEFVPETVAWAHLDIAGPAFAEKDAPLTPKGGTGFGIRMILAYLLSLSS